ncbi:MAG: Ig-like domain-containing protein [Bellilinea sp.]
MTKSAVILRRLLCVIIVLSALLALPNRVSSQTGTKVTLPASSNIFTCQSSLIPVRVENVTSLTAYHLEIDFPPGNVQVTAVENGGFIPNGIFEPTNAIDNIAGTVVFGMARQNYDTPPANGSGVLIFLSVQGVNPGAAVNFTIRPYVPGTEPTNGSGSMLVGWPDLTPIPYTITNGTVYTQSCTSTDIQLSNNQINENLPAGTAVGTFTTIDPDGGAGFTYALWDTATYPDNAYFTISGNELRTNAIFNFETNASYSIRVRSSSDVDVPIYRTFPITITDANDPPVLGLIGARSVNELAPLTFTAAATDADTLPAPDTLTYSLANGTSGLVPAGASIVPNSGAFTWTPTEAQGPSLNTFDVCVSDGAASDCENISVTVNEVNAAPNGADKTVTILEDTNKTFSVTDFPLTDVNDDPINTLAAVKIASLPSVGTLKVSGVNATINQVVTLAELDAGALVYSPALNGNGTGYASFTFQVQDNGGTANSGVDLDPNPKTMTINVTPVNDAPVANAQTESVVEDTPTPITMTGSDIDGNPLTYSIVAQPSHGTLSGSGAARMYTPAANYNGADSFTFRVYDGAAYSPPVTVSITVTPVNDPPVGVADFYYLNSTMYYDTNGDDVKDTYQLIANVDPPGVLQNDSDVDGDALSVTLKTGVAKGALALNPNGSFTYTPNQSLLQDSDSFVYTLSDGHGGSMDVTVNITIDRVGPAVVAQWLSPVTALAGSSNYYGMTYDASTPTVPLKVFVSDISDVAKVEFRWYDHTQTPGVWQIISEDETPTQENGKSVYTATLNMDLLPFTDQIQVWAYTYDVAGSFTRIVKVGNYDYWARIMVNHNPSGYNVFLPFIRR